METKELLWRAHFLGVKAGTGCSLLAFVTTDLALHKPKYQWNKNKMTISKQTEGPSKSELQRLSAQHTHPGATAKRGDRLKAVNLLSSQTPD